jgi:peptidoglycan/xylan/chitin deacetylase (PgdA/CDA1 family)
MSTTPILCYHGVGNDYPEDERPFAFDPAEFATHLDAIAANGVRTVTVSELVRRRRAGDRAALESTVAITFDDGYADLLSTVAPLLAERGMVATAYLTVAYLDRRTSGEPSSARWLSWDEARELASSGVFEIGGHSHDHVQLDVVDLVEARRQLAGTRDRLRDELGTAPESFAYPYGYSNPAVRQSVAAAGFTSACGVKHALSPSDDDPFDLVRVRLLRRHQLSTVTDWILGRGLRVAPCPEEVRTRLYLPVRRVRHRLRTARPVTR